MSTINKMKRKTVNIGKSYNACTKFVQNENGDIEQKTVLYEQSTGSQIQPVFQTKHCKVQVTKGGLLMRFKFDRRRMSMDSIETCVYNETNMITDFLQSETGVRAVSIAEKELEKMK